MLALVLPWRPLATNGLSRIAPNLACKLADPVNPIRPGLQVRGPLSGVNTASSKRLPCSVRYSMASSRGEEQRLVAVAVDEGQGGDRHVDPLLLLLAEPMAWPVRAGELLLVQQ